ncbi:MAG TPA: ABC transporter permease [Vicinamibacterales bacterium]|nr:ABC transporter permease [Vicinamibacterales bacterium]
MSALRRLLLRLFNVLHPGRAEPDLGREIDAHLTLLEDEFQRRGASPEEARLHARRKFGGVELAKELHRDTRSFMWLDQFRHDVRDGARAVARYPVAALVAVVSLAFGIGAMTTTLTVRDVVFRKPPPLYERPAELSFVRVGQPDRQMQDPYGASTPGALFRAWRDASLPGVALAAASPARLRDVRTADGADSVVVRTISPDLFAVLGVGAVEGRTFTEATARAAGFREAVLSRRVWHTLFDDRPDAIGSTIWIENEPFVVVGVTPARFWFTAMNAPIWIPLDRTRLSVDDMLTVVARRPPGMTPEGLIDVLQPSLTAYTRQLPASDRQRRLKTFPVDGTAMGHAMALLLPYVLGASVVLTLLIACANVAVLMIAQWTAREHEIAIRASLGASRGRIVRALVTESMVLAVAGGVFGVCATYALRGILVSRTRGESAFFDLSIDPHILVQAALITLATGILAGMAPALYETRRLHINPLTTLASSDRIRQRWRHALVVLEITVTIALLVETGGMIDGYLRALKAEMGFERRPLLSAQIENTGGIPIAPLLDAVSRVPGVASATAATTVPFAFMSHGASRRVAGDSAGNPEAVAEESSITPGFFSTLGVQLLAGRDFSEAESTRSRIAIINEALARQFFSGQDAIGRRVFIGADGYDIIGVAGDYATNPLERRHIAPKLFLPLRADGLAAKRLQLLVRAVSDPAPLVRSVRQAARDASAGNTVASAFTYDQITEVMGEEMLVGTAPLVPLIAIGMVLTTAGIYGVLAFAIARRSRELAVRVAIGATGRDLLRLVTAQSARLIVTGIALGIGLTFALSRIVRASGGAGSIYDPDWPAFAAPVLIVAAIGGLATLVPSRRAMRIDPAAILRDS